MKKIISVIVLTVGTIIPGQAQNKWEVGAGVTVNTFSRMAVTDVTILPNQDGYKVGLNTIPIITSGNIYLSRQLTPWMYLSLQGTLGKTKDIKDASKQHTLAQSIINLEFRFLQTVHKFNQIDPYVSIGTGYIYKDFDVLYKGSIGDGADRISWTQYNENSNTRNRLMSIRLGGGVNMWMSRIVGIGIDAQHIIMPYDGVLDTFQISAKLILKL